MIREDALETLLGRNLSDIPQRIMYVRDHPSLSFVKAHTRGL